MCLIWREWIEQKFVLKLSKLSYKPLDDRNPATVSAPRDSYLKYFSGFFPNFLTDFRDSFHSEIFKNLTKSIDFAIWNEEMNPKKRENSKKRRKIADFVTFELESSTIEIAHKLRTISTWTVCFEILEEIWIQITSIFSIFSSFFFNFPLCLHSGFYDGFFGSLLSGCHGRDIGWRAVGFKVCFFLLFFVFYYSNLLFLIIQQRRRNIAEVIVRYRSSHVKEW